MYENIPKELCSFKNWIVWKDDKEPYQINGYRASVIDPTHWSNFKDVINALNASTNFSGAGRVLFSGDDYSCIDLDYSKDRTIIERQVKWYNKFNTYSEISPSGNGLHMWVKGKVPTGVRRYNIEVYSDKRYMTMTGNVYNNVPIKECQDLLNELYQELKENESGSSKVIEQKAKYSDDEIINMASNAVNKDLFLLLQSGDWANMYPSQSEADYAFIDIIAFYTNSKEQVCRIFRKSKLGARPKAKRNDYVNQMINKSFDQKLPLIEIEGLASSNLMINGHNILEPVKSNEISLPPGLMGEIALYVYQSAPRPVPEISIVPAIALMAAICGRSYNVLGMGLNQYMMLLANTGIGKDHLSSSFDKLLNKSFEKLNANLINRIQYKFRGPRGFMSGQALDKYIANESQSFIQIVGEFAGTLNKMLDERSNANEKMIHSILRDVYMKSGQGNIYSGIAYSNKDNNTGDTISPAVSILGESNPYELYNILSEQMATGGMLPRFITIAYEGDLSQLNENAHIVQIPDKLIDKLSNLMAFAIKSNLSNQVTHVQFDEASKIKYKEFEKWQTDNYNKYQHSDRIKAFMWSRAPAKTAKLAAAIAIGINPYVPTITVECFDWAANLVSNDIKNLISKFDEGKIGNNENNKQMEDMERTIKEYVTRPWNEIRPYVEEEHKVLWKRKIITNPYFSRRTFRLSSFNGKYGKGRQAGKECIQQCIDNGLLIPINLRDYHGKAWMIKL